MKAPRDHAAAALARLATSRGYSIIHYVEKLDRSALIDVWESSVAKRFDTLEVAFLLSVDEQWTRVVGLAFDVMALPRLLYLYELVMLLNCDAFELGFVESVAWWYSYFEQGLVADRFCSDPLAALHDLRDDIWGADDPRVIFSRCADLDGPRRIRALPLVVQQQLQGNPERLAPILKPSHVQRLASILKVQDPESALEELSRIIALPYIGEYRTTVFLEDFAGSRMLGEPDPDWITEPLHQGLALVMLQHPKDTLVPPNRL